MMNVFEKIISQVEAELESSEKFMREYDDGIEQKAYHSGMAHILYIIQKEVKEHNNGWIPCSERLPEVNNFVLVESEHGIWIVRLIEYGNRKYFVDIYNDYSCPIDSVLAWQPLPQPYKERDTNGKN